MVTDRPHPHLPCSVCESEKEGDLEPFFPDDGTFIQLPCTHRKEGKFFVLLFLHIVQGSLIWPTCAVLCSAVRASCQKLVVRGTEVEASSAEAGNKIHIHMAICYMYVQVLMYIV